MKSKKLRHRLKKWSTFQEWKTHFHFFRISPRIVSGAILSKIICIVICYLKPILMVIVRIRKDELVSHGGATHCLVYLLICVKLNGSDLDVMTAHGKVS